MSRTCPECSNSYEEEVLHCPEDGKALSDVEPDDELLGRSVGSYKVIKPLGKGGMGAVYMAEHPVIGSKVAIKFLHPQYATDKKIVDRFFNEARAVNVIGHDNILKILDLNVTEDNRHYFIMEFLYGKALQDLVKPDEPMPLSVAGPILLQTCEALQAAHDHKIIHRDLKPDNVYLIIHKGRKNFVKVVDFGIAKLTDDSGQSTGKTQTGIVMGTPAYMSPEQAGGMTTKIDGRSDIYSLGVMMFQMATGKLPFPGSSFGEVLIGHLQLPPPEPRSINPGIPEEYQGIILKCLAKSQEERFQTMQELHDAILACMEAEGISRELPLAAPGEAVAPPSVPRTKSSPTRTPAHATALGPKKPVEPQQPQLETAGTGARTGVIAAVAVIGLSVVAGGFAYGGHRIKVNNQIAEERARAEEEKLIKERRDREKREDDARRAAAAARATEIPTVFLTVNSVPGAEIVARLTGKPDARGIGSLILPVSQGTVVHLSASAAGYESQTQDVPVNTSAAVSLLLKRIPRKVGPKKDTGTAQVEKGDDMILELDDEKEATPPK